MESATDAKITCIQDMRSAVVKLRELRRGHRTAATLQRLADEAQNAIVSS